MSTLITEIEAVINSRPLTHVSNDHRDPQALTPSHILLGKKLTEQYNVEVEGQNSSSRDLNIAYGVREGCLKHFWDIWLSEYLHNLPPVASKTNVTNPILSGTLVLVHQENIRHLHWPIERIIKCYLGADGIVRAVDVKLTDGSILKRSINNLHHMETFEADSLDEDSEEYSDLDRSNSQTPLSPDTLNDTHLN